MGSSVPPPAPRRADMCVFGRELSPPSAPHAPCGAGLGKVPLQPRGRRREREGEVKAGVTRTGQGAASVEERASVCTARSLSWTSGSRIHAKKESAVWDAARLPPHPIPRGLLPSAATGRWQARVVISTRGKTRDSLSPCILPLSPSLIKSHPQIVNLYISVDTLGLGLKTRLLTSPTVNSVLTWGKKKKKSKKKKGMPFKGIKILRDRSGIAILSNVKSDFFVWVIIIYLLFSWTETELCFDRRVFSFKRKSVSPANMKCFTCVLEYPSCLAYFRASAIQLQMAI